jgi:hypothetical protein
MRRPWVTACVAVLLALPASAVAQGPFNPPTGDLFALGFGLGQTVVALPVQHNPEPPLTATPLVPCGPGSVEQPGIDGRVPAGSATNGLHCNAEAIGHEGNAGGFRVWRYVDAAGHECAFYDTALVYPSNAFNTGGGSNGVEVLDMSDPTHPVKTATLTEPPMLSPHESVNFNEKRGLIAAVSGEAATAPGFVSIYDASQDCRHPVLQSTTASAQLGHESGFSMDGKTFYAASTAFPSVTAVDVTDPKAPHPIWVGQVFSHGLSLSDDGNRAYIADAADGVLTILDTSEIQARKPDPQVRQVSQLSWDSVSIPQNAIPFTEHGHPYVLEFDEYAHLTAGNFDQVGAARIIDIADERTPRVVANLRLKVNQTDEHIAAGSDPGAGQPAQGYGAHYCNIPTRVDPKVVACSFIVSGLRVFDISKITEPKEIAYYVAPTISAPENFGQASDYAMSQPQIIPSRREIWYSDATSGFYVLRVSKAVWPTAGGSSSSTCSRRFKKRFSVQKGTHIKRVKARFGAKRLTARVKGRTIRVRGRRPTARTRLRLTVTQRNGHRTTRTRIIRPC